MYVTLSNYFFIYSNGQFRSTRLQCHTDLNYDSTPVDVFLLNDLCKYKQSLSVHMHVENFTMKGIHLSEDKCITDLCCSEVYKVTLTFLSCRRNFILISHKFVVVTVENG